MPIMSIAKNFLPLFSQKGLEMKIIYNKLFLNALIQEEHSNSLLRKLSVYFISAT